jgi:DNA-binding FrmR family transcriptional regulator
MSENGRLNQDVLNRLKTARGHLDGIVTMLEQDAYCIDVINQLQAVQAALSKVSVIVLDEHMHVCVTDAIRNNDPAERERVLGEIRDVFEKRSRL